MKILSLQIVVLRMSFAISGMSGAHEVSQTSLLYYRQVFQIYDVNFHKNNFKFRCYNNFGLHCGAGYGYFRSSICHQCPARSSILSNIAHGAHGSKGRYLETAGQCCLRT